MQYVTCNVRIAGKSSKFLGTGWDISEAQTFVYRLMINLRILQCKYHSQNRNHKCDDQIECWHGFAEVGV